MPYIISTMTDSVEYARFPEAKSGGSALEILHSVTVKGGAQLAQKNLVLLGEGPSSRGGIRTEVSDSDLEFLQSHPLFKIHVENGFIEISAGKVNAEKVSKSMALDDGDGKGGSAPLTIKDAQKGGRIPGARLKGATQ